MSCKRLGLAAALLMTACSQRPRAVERIAILTFENLTGDPSLDWMGRGLAEAVGAQLACSARLYALPLQSLHVLDAALGTHPVNAPGISAERPAALAAGVDRILYGTFSRWGAQSFVEDPGSGRVLRTITVAGNNPFDTAAALARALDPAARALPTRNLAALRDYVSALETNDETAAARATSEDPAFGPAWLARAQIALRSKGPAAALDILQQARGQALAAKERAQLDYDVAVLRGDTSARDRALLEAVKAAPADPSPYRTLADSAIQSKQYPLGVKYLRAAVARNPGDGTLWNALGYAAAYTGDLAAATDALRHYGELRPRDANPLDSLGDVHLYLGRPLDAERYYLDAARRDPRFLEGGALLKAAWARLMTGDVKAATATFERYMQSRRGDPLAPLRRAEWLWFTGRRSAAVAALAGTIPAGPELAARVYGELALWQLQLGDAKGARQAAERAVALSPTLGLAHVARFLTGPPATPDEWTGRAAREMPAGPIRDYALGCALLFAREFRAAVPVLQRVYQRSNPAADPGAPVLLAWAYVETGRPKEAAPLLRPNPLPLAAGPGPFTSLWFPRLLYLRGDYATFLALSGPDGLIWGEEQRARK